MNKRNSLALWGGWIMIWACCVVFGAVAVEAAPFSSLSLEEQKILAPYAERWGLLSEAKQQQLQTGAHIWQRMTTEERQQANKQLEVWKQLTPEQQEIIRHRFDRFQRLNPEHRQRLRHVRQEYLELPPATRERLQQDWQALDDRQREGLRQRLLQAEQGVGGARRGEAPVTSGSADSSSGPAQEGYRGVPQKSDQRGRR